MNKIDLSICESGDGGELMYNQVTHDFETSELVSNQAYLAMFGGSSEWWGNAFLDPSEQYSGKTESTIKSTTLTSGGRLLILDSVNKDLEYLKELGNIANDVQITGVNTIKITSDLVLSNSAKETLEVVVSNINTK